MTFPLTTQCVIQHYKHQTHQTLQKQILNINKSVVNILFFDTCDIKDLVLGFILQVFLGGGEGGKGWRMRKRKTTSWEDWARRKSVSSRSSLADFVPWLRSGEFALVSWLGCLVYQPQGKRHATAMKQSWHVILGKRELFNRLSHRSAAGTEWDTLQKFRADCEVE